MSTKAGQAHPALCRTRLAADARGIDLVCRTKRSVTTAVEDRAPSALRNKLRGRVRLIDRPRHRRHSIAGLRPLFTGFEPASHAWHGSVLRCAANFHAPTSLRDVHFARCRAGGEGTGCTCSEERALRRAAHAAALDEARSWRDVVQSWSALSGDFGRVTEKRPRPAAVRKDASLRVASLPFLQLSSTADICEGVTSPPRTTSA
jgi:hypothetical protein